MCISQQPVASLSASSSSMLVDALHGCSGAAAVLTHVQLHGWNSLALSCNMALALQECDAHIAKELQFLSERQSVDSVSFLDHVNRCWQVSKMALAGCTAVMQDGSHADRCWQVCELPFSLQNQSERRNVAC